MKKTQLVLLSLLIAVSAMGQIPTLISVSGDEMSAYFSNDFNQVLAYASQGADTIMLSSGGYAYTTQDTFPMVINSSVVIMAAPGLAEKPILTHTNPDTSGSMEIFRITENVVFDGIAFEGNHYPGKGLKYALRYGDFENTSTGAIKLGKRDVNITILNCDFNSFHSLGDQDKQGNAIYFLKPIDVTTSHLRAHKVHIENCTFTDIGDEAIRIAENQKYPTGPLGTVAFDTLIVRDCTFDDVDAECVRIYGDLDTSFTGPTWADGLALIENITVVNSAPRFIYAKEYRQTIVRDVLVAHSRGTSINRPDRGDYTMQIQLSGSSISHVDTFNVGHAYTLAYDPKIGATKGGEVDESTIYGFDPQFTDFAAGNYEAQSTSPLYWKGTNQGFIGDRRWATDPPPEAIDYVAKPDRFSLDQNYPNPFNPSTTINFNIERPDFTTLQVFNVLGQLVATPKSGFLMAGDYSVVFDASELANGVYFYELRQGMYSDIKKMILIK